MASAFLQIIEGAENGDRQIGRAALPGRPPFGVRGCATSAMSSGGLSPTGRWSCSGSAPATERRATRWRRSCWWTWRAPGARPDPANVRGARRGLAPRSPAKAGPSPAAVRTGSRPSPGSIHPRLHPSLGGWCKFASGISRLSFRAKLRRQTSLSPSGPGT